jgi:hypothetical protein
MLISFQKYSGIDLLRIISYRGTTSITERASLKLYGEFNNRNQESNRIGKYMATVLKYNLYLD